MENTFSKEYKNYEFVVIGGGISGIVAAIAAARQGVKTVLINNRPVLGGNASSEIRMHICGADHHSEKKNARETGILEELLLKNKYRNASNSFSLFDTTLWEAVEFQENLDLYLNTHIQKVNVRGDKIVSVVGVQLTSEKEIEFSADNFLDSTGDGTVGFLAGAEFMEGRESSRTFQEMNAPEKADHQLMGNSLMFTAIDTGKPVKFIKPEWAHTYSEEDLAHRNHMQIDSGYWWIEMSGSEYLSTINNYDAIRTELLKVLFGVWDHIKNQGDHGADNYELDWVQFLPGKRESRRLIGDYVLTANDLVENKHFADAIAYGGWPMDIHAVGGMGNGDAPTTYYNLKGTYSIPYRCLYSRNVKNLFIGGRNISVSHLAFGSTRVMGTCAVVGEAVGIAASLARKYHCSPAEVGRHIDELQQLALKEDLYIPSLKNQDKADLARESSVSASSFIKGFEPSHIINGIGRSVDEKSNCWKAASDKNEWVMLTFSETRTISKVILRFDSNLSIEVMPTLSKPLWKAQDMKVQKSLVKNYVLKFMAKGRVVAEKSFSNNYLRNLNISMEAPTQCDQLKIECSDTNGSSAISIFEVRAYE